MKTTIQNLSPGNKKGIPGIRILFKFLAIILFLGMPFMAQKVALVVHSGVIGNTALNKAVARLEKEDYCPVISLLKHKQEIKIHINEVEKQPQKK